MSHPPPQPPPLQAPRTAGSRSGGNGRISSATDRRTLPPPMLNTYMSSQGPASRQTISPPPLPPGLSLPNAQADDVRTGPNVGQPVYFHVNQLSQQNRLLRQMQPAFHSRRASDHRVALYQAPTQQQTHTQTINSQTQSHSHSHPHPYSHAHPPPHLQYSSPDNQTQQQLHQQQQIHIQHHNPNKPPPPYHSQTSRSRHASSQYSPSHHRTSIEIPLITDTNSLIRAVTLNADQAFIQLQKVSSERDNLKISNRSLREENINIKADFEAARKGHERLHEIWLEKQLLFWRFVERVRVRDGGVVIKADGDVAGGGEWVSKESGEDEDVLSKEDVDELWSAQFRKLTVDYGSTGGEEWSVSVSEPGGDVVLPEEAEENEMGRSRMTKTTLVVDLVDTETVSTTENDGSVVYNVSATESVDGESSDTLGLRLDPSAKPFEPSPTRTEAKRASPFSLPTPSTSDLVPLKSLTTPQPSFSPSHRILSFRDILAGAGSPVPLLNKRPKAPDSPQISPTTKPKSKENEKPWIEVKNRKNNESHEHSASKASVKEQTTKADLSRESSRARGGGNKKKTKQGGAIRKTVSPYPTRRDLDSVGKSPAQTNEKSNALIRHQSPKQYGRGNSQKNNLEVEVRQQSIQHGHGHPSRSPRRIDNPWRLPRLDVTSRKTEDQLLNSNSMLSPVSAISPNTSSPRNRGERLRHRPRKVSPSIERVANLPLHPNPMTLQPLQSITGTGSKSSTTPHTTAQTQQHRYDLRERKNHPPLLSDVDTNAIGFEYTDIATQNISRARLQATLMSLREPYHRVCPFSLLTGKECRIRGCELLNLCSRYISSFTQPDSSLLSSAYVVGNKGIKVEDEFPPLGSEMSKLGSRCTNGLTCKKQDGSAVKEGETCDGGFIHLRPTCGEEVNGATCRFRMPLTAPPFPPSQHNSITDSEIRYSKVDAKFSSKESGSLSDVGGCGNKADILAKHNEKAPRSHGKKFRAMSLDYDYYAPLMDWRLPTSNTDKSTAFSASAAVGGSSNPLSNAQANIISGPRAPLLNTHLNTNNNTIHNVTNIRDLRPYPHVQHPRLTQSSSNNGSRLSHLKTYIHESDGAVRREAWYLRCLNAGLRNAHQAGIWGVADSLDVVDIVTGEVCSRNRDEVGECVKPMMSNEQADPDVTMEAENEIEVEEAPTTFDPDFNKETQSEGLIKWGRGRKWASCDEWKTGSGE